MVHVGDIKLCNNTALSRLGSGTKAKSYVNHADLVVVHPLAQERYSSSHDHDAPAFHYAMKQKGKKRCAAARWWGSTHNYSNIVAEMALPVWIKE